MSDIPVDYVLIRQFIKSDIPFVLDTSISSLSKYRKDFFRGYNDGDLRAHLELVFLYVLTNYEKYNIFVACTKEDSENIIAYIVADSQKNHIVMQYTKYVYRKLKVQRMLMPLVLDLTKKITVNWGTKEMLKLENAKRIRIKNLLLEDLIRSE